MLGKRTESRLTRKEIWISRKLLKLESFSKRNFHHLILYFLILYQGKNPVDFRRKVTRKENGMLLKTERPNGIFTIWSWYQGNTIGNFHEKLPENSAWTEGIQETFDGKLPEKKRKVAQIEKTKRNFHHLITIQWENLKNFRRKFSRKMERFSKRNFHTWSQYNGKNLGDFRRKVTWKEKGKLLGMKSSKGISSTWS